MVDQPPASSEAVSSDTSTRGKRTGMWSIFGVHSVVGQMFVLQVVLMALLALGAVLLMALTIRSASTDDARHRSLAAAQSFADAPGTAKALTSSHPTAVLQPRAEAARRGADIDFIVVVDRQGIRVTHPVPSRIGKSSDEDMAPVLRGQTIQSRTGGSLGPQYRAIVPVRAADGRVVGGVSAGVTIKNIDSRLMDRLPVVLGAAAAAVAAATGGALVLSRRLLRQTHGLGPTEITRLYEHHDAVLHAAREGVLIVDGDRRVLLANDEARRLLDLPGDVQGRHVGGFGFAAPIADLLASGREAADEVHLVGGRILAVNQRPLDQYGGPAGSVVTLRDSTELEALSGRVEASRERLTLLYDAAVEIGTTLDVRQTAEELAKVAVPQLADFVTVDLAEPVLRGDEPEGMRQQFRRTAAAGISDDAPMYPTGELIRFVRSGPQALGMDSGRGTVVPNLREAAGFRAQDPVRAQQVIDFGIHSLIAAPLYARGVVLGVATFWRLRTGPFEEDDLALAEELVARAAVCIDNARRYTRERSTAVMLQRSLLPGSLPVQNALDVAYRYLPAHRGVGGDWFDVIPLSGARVALVVGDVVGQGLHAAATMGRLRTAVQNFSALDLPPDEILARLDDLTDGEERSRGPEESSSTLLGATCLYAVYDPVARRCVLARAGHLPPALVRPDNTVEFLELPAGPPLGVGSLPFSSAEIDVPEGSRLVLYTDGLVERRDRDIDESLHLLGDTLRHAGAGSEQTCDAVLEAMLSGPHRDDTVVLVARTRALPRHLIARWDVPRDPTAVGRMRAAVTDQLATWDLEDIGFATEVILSELVTNALRHAVGPIAVRLLLDRKLICEVSDESNTSPHLQYAAVTDEGGRGLFLVAQLAERWGTRYTADGKVIWTEQPLPDGYRWPSA